MNLTISPCPNDTFSFYHWVHQPQCFHDLNVEYLDVQSCNEYAIQKTSDIIKVSFAVYPLVQRDYVILDAGSALGKGCGPLLVANQGKSLDQITKIAVPGKNTSANKLLKLIYKGQADVVYTTYEQVIPMVKSGKADAGVIIHENRFTYQYENMSLLLDLGAKWEQDYSDLLPLGGIIAKRSLGKSKIQEITSCISNSIAWAFSHPKDQLLNEYIQTHAQEMDLEVVHKHINLYVNDHSLALKESGKNAIIRFLKNDLCDDLQHFSSQL